MAGPLGESSLRRRLPAELREIRRHLQQFGTDDELSQHLQQWVDGLSAALRTQQDVRPILQAYIRLMQELLVDSMSLIPLDDAPLLGSDGRTYGTKHLCIHLSRSPESARTRSPLEPNSDVAFSTKPHSTARHMLGWLHDHGARLQSERVDQMYAQLNQPRLSFIIPNRRNDRLRRIWLNQQPRRQALQGIETPLDRLRERSVQQVDGMLSRYDQRITSMSREIKGQEEQIRERNRREAQQMQTKIDQLDKELKGAQKEIDKLSSQIEQVGALTSLAEEADLQLKLALKQLEKAIKERNKRRWTSILLAAVAIPGAFLGSWALSGALSSMGAGSAVSASVSALQGGLKVSASIAL